MRRTRPGGAHQLGQRILERASGSAALPRAAARAASAAYAPLASPARPAACSSSANSASVRPQRTRARSRGLLAGPPP